MIGLKFGIDIFYIVKNPEEINAHLSATIRGAVNRRVTYNLAKNTAGVAGCVLMGFVTTI